jgi:hypothetical protein
MPYFFLPDALADDVLLSALLSPAAGISPITDFKGQTENAGHFLQPVTSAIGQSVMMSP